MGLLTRRRTPVDAETPLPAAWLDQGAPGSKGSVVLTHLGSSGYGLRHPDTHEPLDVRDEYAQSLGVMVVQLADFAERRDPARCEASKPGSELTLIPEKGGKVAVNDGTGSLDIGYIAEESAAIVSQALNKDIRLRALSLWEVTTPRVARRTELRILLVPRDVEIVFAVETARTIVLPEPETQEVEATG